MPSRPRERRLRKAAGLMPRMVAPSSLLTSTSFFRKVGPLNTDRLHSDSADWFLRAREAGATTELLPDVLVRRRLHADNRSRTYAARSGEEVLKIIKAKLDRERRGKPRE